MTAELIDRLDDPDDEEHASSHKFETFTIRWEDRNAGMIDCRGQVTRWGEHATDWEDVLIFCIDRSGLSILVSMPASAAQALAQAINRRFPVKPAGGTWSLGDPQPAFQVVGKMTYDADTDEMEVPSNG